MSYSTSNFGIFAPANLAELELVSNEAGIGGAGRRIPEVGGDLDKEYGGELFE